MADVTRTTKAGGTTDVQTGQLILPGDLNDDVNSLVAAINDLDNNNVADSADIALTKLGDISSTDANHIGTTSPGDSSAHSNPTTLSGELKQLRYAIERNALGINAQRMDAGTGVTGWIDRPAIGPNLLRNGSFEGYTPSGSTPANLPDGWSYEESGAGTDATLSVVATAAVNGLGRAVRIQAAAAITYRLTQTLVGLKASTRYLVACRALVTSGTAHLITTGANVASSYRDIDDSTSDTSYSWLVGVIETDTTPTDIIVKLATHGGIGDDVRFDHVCVRECSRNDAAVYTRDAIVVQQVLTTAGTPITGATTDAGLGANYQFLDDGTDDLDRTVYVPGPGYYIRVTVDVNAREAAATNTGNAELILRLYRSVNGAALSVVRDFISGVSGTAAHQKFFGASTTYIVSAPTPGASYRFAVAASRLTGGATVNITPQLSQYQSSLTIEVLPWSV